MQSVHTIGYQGTSFEPFRATLLDNGITLLIDLRERSASRKPGFSKSALQVNLGHSGIGYEHWRELGTPKPIRDLLRKQNDWEAYRLAYSSRLAGQRETLERLALRMRDETACLLCFERDAHECHRSLVVGRMRELGLIDEVRHLVALNVLPTAAAPR